MYIKNIIDMYPIISMILCVSSTPPYQNNIIAPIIATTIAIKDQYQAKLLFAGGCLCVISKEDIETTETEDAIPSLSTDCAVIYRFCGVLGNVKFT